jgi:hypothetical protein
MKLIHAGVVSIAMLMAGCGGGHLAEPGPGTAAAPETAALTQAAQATPLVASVDNAPVPVKGSDGRYHVVYELTLFNFTGAAATLNQLRIVDSRSGAAVASFDAAQIAARLGVDGSRSAKSATLGPSQTGIVYLHLTFDTPSVIPAVLAHELSLELDKKPLTETVAPTRVPAPTTLALAPPLKGGNFIAGDGCCDSIRHVRATLPVNGRLFNGQRFAIDWEQLDAQGRIYVGDPKLPQSYVIYNQPVYAVADATVVAVVNAYPDSPPGALPANMTLEQADGNHVILDLGNGHYALYAHLAPNSLMVTPGQRVRQGEMLGRVGTSGNSSEPHLHFQVSDGPNPLASNGVPYVIQQFTASQRAISTEAYDQATANGQPMPIEPIAGAPQRIQAMPLDLLIVDFPH